MLEPMKWLLGTPSERQARSATSLFCVTLGVLVFAVLGKTVLPTLVHSWVTTSSLARSCSTLLRDSGFIITINAFVLGILVAAGAIVGAIVERRISLSSYQRLIIWYCARTLILGICLLEIAWAIRAVLEGQPLSAGSTAIALIALVFGMSLIDPLRKKCRARSRHDPDQLNLRPSREVGPSPLQR